MVEDFTFPTMPPVQCGAKKLPFPRFTSPPAPWFVVPADAGAHDHHRRCFLAAEHAGKANNDVYPGREGRSERFTIMEEHKMDMLWEDFNEELARAPQPCPLGMEWSSEAWLTGQGDGIPSRHVVVTGTGSSVVRRRRLSLMMMLNLLKKLFLARRSSTTSRKTPPI